MLKDVGIEVPKSIETRSKCSMHAGDDNMQQCLTPFSIYRCRDMGLRVL